MAHSLYVFHLPVELVTELFCIGLAPVVVIVAACKACGSLLVGSLGLVEILGAESVGRAKEDGEGSGVEGLLVEGWNTAFTLS